MEELAEEAGSEKKQQRASNSEEESEIELVTAGIYKTPKNCSDC